MEQTKKRRITHGVLAALVLVGLLVYAFFTYTMQGRLAGLYLVAGWSAPSDVQVECKNQSYTRVAELFLQPLDMTEDAKNALREYWHYSYYRECLYHAGYTFMGKPLAASSIESNTYRNPLAGTILTVPTGTQLLTSNELDVMFDYRLLRSTLDIDGTSISFDYYTEHQFITTFEDLPDYLDHFPASENTFTHIEARTTSTGVPYLLAREDGGLCGAVAVTPDAGIVHVFGDCKDETRVLALMDTISFFPRESVH